MKISTRQTRFIRYTTRKKKLHLVTIGKIGGKRARERQRIKNYSLSTWHGMSATGRL